MAAAPSSSGPFFGIREENQNQMKQLHSSSTGLPPPKKKRNHPGNPSKSRCGSGGTISQGFNGNKQVHLLATALLKKAAQLGSSSSGGSNNNDDNSLLRSFRTSSSTGTETSNFGGVR
ncbi:hypothetical protein V6N11_011587 [Hibiscus sabdariffa]|uniref:Uncharacterized protein n=1 Tax=Hibiscus sabdariffa TaxID=183260 RepID=A0ABR2S9G6_9ROSI